MSLVGLLNQTAQYEDPNGTQNRQGDSALGSATQMRVRVERTNKTIVTAEREREPIDAIIYAGPNESISIGGRFTYQGQQFRVMRLSDVVGFNGRRDHWEVEAQLWSFAS